MPTELTRPAPLSPKEKMVLEFIEGFIADKGFAPSFGEIKGHFRFASFNSVQRYLKQLQEKGYVSVPGGNQKRAISVLQSADAAKQALKKELSLKSNNNNAVPKGSPRDLEREGVLHLPLLGRVAAGLPIEESQFDETITIPLEMVKIPSRTYTLKVKGNSMIEDGIFDGDVLVVQEQSTARNGEVAVADIGGEATVKRFYFHSGPSMATPQIELRPANPDMESLWFPPDQVRVRGIVVGLLRKF